jgi:endonuclease III
MAAKKAATKSEATKAAASKSRPAAPHATGAPKGYKPTDPERVKAILHGLAKAYPDAKCALRHDSAWQLLVATILSAQTTDVGVNLATPELFRRFPTPAALAKAPVEEVEGLIRTTGFFHNKTKSIIGAAKKVLADFGGEVPKTIEELITIPGVARKTANVVLGSWFGLNEGVVVDTHVFRLSHRLDLSQAPNPEKTEQDLQVIIPRQRWTSFSHELIHHGRQVCVARTPRCADCTIETLCHSADKTWSTVWQHKPAKIAKIQMAAK